MNKRRKLLIALGASALSPPLCSFAQQQKVYRIGVLSATLRSSPLTPAFVHELRRLGYIEGENLSIVYRIADGNLQRLPAFATDEPQVAPQLEQVREAAGRLGMTVHTTQLLSRDDFDRTQKLLRSWRVDSICVVESLTNYNNRELLTEFAAQMRLPAIYANGGYADAGGLVSYGANYEALNRRAAHYVDKILKGARPADLPVEQPTTFEMAINRKTANALGLTIPQPLLMSADKVIE